MEFIGSYDNRPRTGTIAAQDAHEMVKASQVQISTPRKPKARTFEEIKRRAEGMGVYTEKHGREIYFGFTTHTGQYIVTTQKYAWQVLNEIAAEILASKSNDAIASEAEKSLSFFS